MKEKRLFWRILLALAALVLVANVMFWILVGVQFSPVSSRYEGGRIVRLGPVALVFGHGDWGTVDGIESHFTTVADRGNTISEPTIQLVERLHQEGARWIWGTWCYSGDHDYVVKDHITGEEIPWPEYVSRNRHLGMTLPVWVGLGFVRLGLGPAHQYDEYSSQHEYLLPTDTAEVDLDLWRSSEAPLSAEDAAAYAAGRVLSNAGFPDPDSVTGVSPKEITWDHVREYQLWIENNSAYWAGKITNEEWSRRNKEQNKLEAQNRIAFESRFAAATETVQANAWIRGKVVPVWIRIKPTIIHKY